MSDARIMELVEQAVGYRGHVTVERRDGSRIVGFVYDSAAAHIEMFDERATDRIRVAHAEIANITLSGEDSAAKAQRIWERRRDSLESRETSVWGGWEARPTLILVALPIELRGIAPVLGSSVIARAVGVGGGATHVVAAERPRLVISCGFSGALHASLGPGDLVLASSVRDESGETVAARESVLRITRRALDGRARVAEGEILGATRIAATYDDKRALAGPGRLAVDLESWSAARAAERAGLPWLVLRVVLDPLEINLPPFAGDARAGYLASALHYALGGPRPVLEIARLGIRTAIALRSLRGAVQELLPVLGRLDGAEVRS